MGYITKKGVAVRVKRAVTRALKERAIATPFSFTTGEMEDHDAVVRGGGFGKGQEVLRETHVVFTAEELAVRDSELRAVSFVEGQEVLRRANFVLTQSELASRLEAARDEVTERFERSFPHMMTAADLLAHDAKVREEHEKSLNARLVAELAAKRSEASAEGAKQAVEAISAMVATAFSGCNFEDNPEFVYGLGMLAKFLFDQARKKEPGTPEAEFGFDFADSIFVAMEGGIESER